MFWSLSAFLHAYDIKHTRTHARTHYTTQLLIPYSSSCFFSRFNVVCRLGNCLCAFHFASLLQRKINISTSLHRRERGKSDESPSISWNSWDIEMFSQISYGRYHVEIWIFLMLFSLMWDRCLRKNSNDQSSTLKFVLALLHLLLSVSGALWLSLCLYVCLYVFVSMRHLPINIGEMYNSKNSIRFCIVDQCALGKCLSFSSWNMFNCGWYLTGKWNGHKCN